MCKFCGEKNSKHLKECLIHVESDDQIKSWKAGYYDYRFKNRELYNNNDPEKGQDEAYMMGWRCNEGLQINEIFNKYFEADKQLYMQ